MSETVPILYSFRRCPYAMRARMSLVIAGQSVQLREVVLRDKPAEMLTASAKGTVPVLILPSGRIIDESIDVMHWALMQSDPEGWGVPNTVAMDKLIAENDGPFKHHLDRFKYATRYEGADPDVERASAEEYLAALDARLLGTKHLMGDSRSLADIAIFPFVRQFISAANERTEEGFSAQRFPSLNRWLKGHVSSPLFAAVMTKYPQWQSGQPGVNFPE